MAPLLGIMPAILTPLIYAVLSARISAATAVASIVSESFVLIPTIGSPDLSCAVTPSARSDGVTVSAVRSSSVFPL